MATPKALITGASTGIGAVYAERLARRGYDLILVARDRERLQALAQRLQADTGRRVEVCRADLLERADLLQVERLLLDDPDIAWLVNNAGIAGSGAFSAADPDKLEAIVGLNVQALTRLAAAAARRFASRGGGAIVNLGSVVALMPESFEAVYLASKAYVLALSQAMHQELSQYGVRVQAVLPGVTRTEIWERSGMSVDALPAAMVMEAGDMVDAALAGFDLGEVVTIPSLPDIADWERYTQARLQLKPGLSLSRPAARYATPAG